MEASVHVTGVRVTGVHVTGEPIQTGQLPVRRGSPPVVPTVCRPRLPLAPASVRSRALIYRLLDLLWGLAGSSGLAAFANRILRETVVATTIFLRPA